MVYEQIAFLIGRILMGGFFIFNGFNHFRDLEAMQGYAESKGAPMPGLTVPLTGLMLLIGGLSVLTGAYVTVGVALIVLFFLSVTPMMHDFWSYEGDQRQSEMTNFMKNLALLGAALTLLMVQSWPYAIQTGL
ncbi:MAG: DoxX family protein [Candidatus Nanohaloarchaea archaeon]|nr:DoxX family protein [Candidatus Nanohaloarchaea archaeon]